MQKQNMSAEIWKDFIASGVQEQHVPHGMVSCVSDCFVFCVCVPGLKDYGREGSKVSQLIPALH